MKVIKGKGKAYNKAANSIKSSYFNWLNYNDTTEDEFRNLIACKPHDILIEHKSNYVSVSIYAGHKLLLCPFLWKEDGGISLRSYWTDLFLLLYFIASRFPDSDILPVVETFAKEHKNEY